MTADDGQVAQSEKLLRLLWRHDLPPRTGARGPKQHLSVDEVVAAGLAVAARDGYHGVSIRSVAAELGVRPMSLYTYVPSRDALIVLMVDAVAAADEPIDPALPLPERMRAIAAGIRAELLAHPWLLEVPPWRQVLGPGRMGRYERQLAALEGAGLSDLEMDRTIAVLSEFAAGNARTAVARRRAIAEMPDARWWELFGPLLGRVVPAGRFPLADRVGAAVGEIYQAPADPDGDFEYGLRSLVAGLTAGLGRG
ncbi:TetR/AcrR family transcriptional regulator C-terminal domain-containing protein [Nocardia stercoris]|uniref:TetR family transcriptional regulator n=1 Tax=Nocardia stercoris TaxID=2483361 RepID=A0A3M2L062_9NOCA|nr:TetR/AcrR family transcriptional regulator C-terminal domain-containing protein [Nocardia stercoris]RMI30090.1 TetR family transcriptional regulator [Nocardia stercoris]